MELNKLNIRIRIFQTNVHPDKQLEKRSMSIRKASEPTQFDQV